MSDPTVLMLLLFIGIVLTLANFGKEVMVCIPYLVPELYATLYGRELFVVTKCKWEYSQPIEDPTRAYSKSPAYTQHVLEHNQAIINRAIEWAECKQSGHEACGPMPVLSDAIIPYAYRIPLYNESYIGTGSDGFYNLFNTTDIYKIRKQYYFHIAGSIRSRCEHIISHFEKTARIKFYGMPWLMNKTSLPKIYLTLEKNNDECTNAILGSDGKRYNLDAFKLDNLHLQTESEYVFQPTEVDSTEDCPDLVEQLRDALAVTTV
jgi:hypothetical protein